MHHHTHTHTHTVAHVPAHAVRLSAQLGQKELGKEEEDDEGMKK